jgi:hypothetical protein
LEGARGRKTKQPMKPTQLITYTLITVVLATSCKRKMESEGIVTNKATGEPIEGATVVLKDGLGTSDPFLSSDGATAISKAVTGADGKYFVSIKTKSSTGVLGAYKEGYRFVNPSNGSERIFTGVFSGLNKINLQLEGTALFNGYFQKNSSTPKSTDVIKISLLSYDNINENYNSRPTKEYDGEGPFRYNGIDGNPVTVLGDRYLRYKLEFSGNGGASFQTKIDSVFLPTSLTEYKETIYY